MINGIVKKVIAPKKEEKKNPSTSAQAFQRFNNTVVNTVYRSIKMASAKICDEHIHPLELLEEIKKLGVNALAWAPETLIAAIDRQCSGWTDSEIENALLHFQETGEIKTNVPALTRQKIYALRTIMTSDSPHNEWHVFEKVGSVLNGRPANWDTVEPLSPVECAKAISMIEAIRPDSYSNEIKAYIAASCHQEGFYTLQPSKYLSMAEGMLQMMNREETGRSLEKNLADAILSKTQTFKADPVTAKMSEDFVTIQALKILAIDTEGDLARKV